jgi:hypothetical protein
MLRRGVGGTAGGNREGEPAKGIDAGCRAHYSHALPPSAAGVASTKPTAIFVTVLA